MNPVQDGMQAMGQAAQAVNTWFHAPFRGTAYSPLTYFLLVGLVLVFALVWGRVIAHIERGITE